MYSGSISIKNVQKIKMPSKSKKIITKHFFHLTLCNFFAQIDSLYLRNIRSPNDIGWIVFMNRNKGFPFEKF